MEEFLNLKQGRKFFKKYSLKFHQLSRYASEMVSIMRDRMHKFTLGLSRELVLESKATSLIKYMDIFWLVVYMQQVEEKMKKK